MIKASDKKNVIAVVLTNISTILVNVLTCLFLPKIMNIDDYSLYRTFLLYSSYSGLLSFGLIHGIYIKYGSLNFDALPEEHFRYYNRLLIIITILSYIFLSAILFLLIRLYPLFLLRFFWSFWVPRRLLPQTFSSSLQLLLPLSWLLPLRQAAFRTSCTL